MDRQYSRRSPAVKRLMKEAQELSEPTEQCYAQPLEDNLFEWHFTVRGPPDSNFEGGVYHGRITLPPDYPMKPPSIMLLTPTGRFEVGTKICLSISGHHPETWQPSWSIRTVMLAIIGFMPTKGEGAIGSLDYTAEERKTLAKRSQDWTCPLCKVANKSILPKETSTEKSKEMQREAAEIASQITFKKEDDKKKPTDSTSNNRSSPQPPAANANPANPLPPNPYAAFNPAAMAGMYPYPPNYMNMNPMTQPPANPNQAATPSPSAPTNPSQGSSPPTGQSPPQNAQSNAPATPSNVAPELRQRVTAGSAAPTQVGSNQATPPRTNPQRNPQDRSGGQWALVMMFITTLIMVFLLVRRAYNTYEYKLYQGEL